MKKSRSIIIFFVIMVTIAIGFIGLMTKISSGDNKKAVNNEFFGEAGDALGPEQGKLFIEESKVIDGKMHPFNYYSEKMGKNIYFFVVKASDGTYRAAANACEVCYDSKEGFKQIGEQIRCENCRTTYSKDQIALQKGGCNPRPIDKNIKVVGGRLAINLADIEKTADLF